MEKEIVHERVSELCCNIDDMTGEELGFAVETLLQSGAFDVWTTPIYMKKSRPAVLLTCLCPENKREFFINLILKYTSTLGVRETLCDRYILKRETVTYETAFGSVRFKRAYLPDGTVREKPEYEDIADIAKKHGVAFSDTKRLVSRSDAEKQKVKK